MPRGALITGKPVLTLEWFDVIVFLGPHDNILPCIVLGPTHGQIHDAAGLSHIFKTSTDMLHDLTLLIQIPGAPCGLTEWVIQI